MTALEYILDGLEAELALERELGVRSVECDRSLLAMAPAVPAPSASKPVEPPKPVVADVSPKTIPANRTEEQPNDRKIFDFVFVHDRALSPKGVEMMAKIVTALGKTAETAPIAIVPPLPKARIYVVLGGLALKRFFPGIRGEPGQWQTAENGADVLITYSPEYILRFPTVTSAVMAMKKSMWTSLKAVAQRVKA